MPATAHRVVVLGLAPVVGYDLAIPPLFFGEASDSAGRPLYDVVVASVGGLPLPTSAGYAVLPTADESALARADTVIVPGTKIPGPRRDGVLDDSLAEALALIRPGTRLVSICTGAFVLGAAGLLDGRRATTHWAYASDFRRLFPRVELDEGVLLVDDGDVLTSAGLAAGADLCLHLIRRDHGADVANAVARHCVVPPWRDGGQAQFIEHPMPRPTTDSTADTRTWALAHLGDDLDVAGLARRSHMSVRTFTRRFTAETGQAPGRWLIEQRLRLAMRLLETTDLPVDDVAERSGLGSGVSLRHHLRAKVKVTPAAYRRTFRGEPSTLP